MRLEQKFVIPLPVEEARRLVAEFERFAPMVPGLAVRIQLDPRDERSTGVRIVGELRTGGGLAATVVTEAAARILRQYVSRLSEQAQNWAASRLSSSPASGGATVAGDAAPAAGEGGLPDPPRRTAPPVQGRPADVWASVTDPVGGSRRPARRSAPARRPGMQVSARDVVAVTGAAVAFAVAHRAVQRRLRRGAAPVSELPPRMP